MKKLVHQMLHWFSGNDARSLDRYLANASNAADVERLMRQWESRERSGLHLP